MDGNQVRWQNEGQSPALLIPSLVLLPPLSGESLGGTLVDSLLLPGPLHHCLSFLQKPVKRAGIYIVLLSFCLYFPNFL